MSVDFSQLKDLETQAAEAEKEALKKDEPEEKLGFFEKRRQMKEEAAEQGDIEHHEHLMAVKPKRGYVYRSDYFEVDGGVASIIGLFQDESAEGTFGPFWGISKVPHGLPYGVSVAILEQTKAHSQKWVEDKIKGSERIESFEATDMEETSSRTSRRAMTKISRDMEEIAAELARGSSYLNVHYRLMVKAPSLEVLDDAMKKITQTYSNNFGVINLGVYPGEQRQEHSALFNRNEDKRGKGFDFTSEELAGSYSFVTNGINDPQGEYLGRMANDVNTSGVVFNVNGYKSHIVVADDNFVRDDALHTQMVADMWGSKISQSCLLDNGRVVHLVLNATNLDLLGPKFEKISTTLDMNVGDINMMAMFGKQEDELSIFPAHLTKLVLMIEQLAKSQESDSATSAIIQGYLREELKKFYIDRGMWLENAQYHRDKLRVVGVPHEDVPRLQDLMSYFETGYKASMRGNDSTTTNAYNVLRMIIRDMVSANGSLFNTYTNPYIERTALARRVVYDFSQLASRGRNIAMAQLVNVISFAVNSLGAGDTLIIHGAEEIDDSVKEYLGDQIHMLRRRRGRVAYLYGDIHAMLEDRAFNRFDRADFTILGPMPPALAEEYQDTLKQKLSPELERAITRTDEDRAYIRRGHENVVFTIDMPLGRTGVKAEGFVAPKKGEKGYVPPIDELLKKKNEPIEADETPELVPSAGTMDSAVSLDENKHPAAKTGVRLRQNTRRRERKSLMRKR